MIGLWVPVTLGAAGLQAVRTAQQKRLTATIGQGGANWSRYLFGAPPALLLVAGLALAGGAVAVPPPLAVLYGLIGGVAQILATACLIHGFTIGGFAVATTYSKTEPIQVALLATLVLSEPLNGSGWLAVGLGFLGVVILGARGGLARPGPAMAYGLASGFFFAVASVAIRACALALPAGDAFERAAVTLALITALQTVLLGLWLAWRHPLSVRATLTVGWPAWSIGLMSVTGSFAWFWAMTLEPVAHVRALGQAELVFTLVLSHRAFREAPSRRELLAMGLIVASVLALLLGLGG